jgi:hypothetical protein
MRSPSSDESRRDMFPTHPKNLFRFFAHAVVLGAFVVGPPASATTLVPFGVEDLTNESDRIVVGTVSAILQTLDGKEDQGFAFVVLTLEDSWKGAPARSVTLKVLGGQTSEDPARTRITGAPSFVPGGSYVLFLTARPEEGGKYFNVTGWSQGNLERRPDGNLKDGRSLKDLRREIERHLRHPHPKKFGKPVRAAGKSSVPPVTPAFRPLSARKIPAAKPKEVRHDEGNPSRPSPLTPLERKKLQGGKTGDGL